MRNHLKSTRNRPKIVCFFVRERSGDPRKPKIEKKTLQEPPKSVPRASKSVQGASWEALGASWERLGNLLRRLRTFLGAPRDPLGRHLETSWGILEAQKRLGKHLGSDYLKF